MLGKLIKHDFKALGRTLLPLQVGTLIIGIMASLFLTIAVRYVYNESSLGYGNDQLTSLLVSVALLCFALFATILVASFFVTLFLVARHFYANLMGDEGYLTFTLPVTTNQIILGKTISGFCWMLINTIVIGIAFVIMLIFGAAYEGVINLDVLEVLGGFLKEVFSEPSGVLFIVMLPLTILTSILNSLLLVYVAIAVGGVFAVKHKVVAAVGAYFVISMVTGALNSVIGMLISATTALGFLDNIFLLGIYDLGGLFFSMNLTLIVNIVIAIATAAAYYAATHYLLSNRLNLE